MSKTIAYELVQKLDKDSVDTLIGMIASANLYDDEWRWENGETLLHWASAFNHVEIVKYILDNKKLHVNIENYRGTNSLIYACKKDVENAAVIRLLLTYKADPSITSGFTGMRPDETVEDEGLKTELIQSLEKIPLQKIPNGVRVKPGFTLYQSYQYRKYKWALMHLNYLTSKWKHIVHGFEPHPQLLDMFEAAGALEFSKFCDQELETYHNMLVDDDDDEKKCLECGDIIDTLKKCGRCKKVYFCDRMCQMRANMFHKYDCKSE